MAVRDVVRYPDARLKQVCAAARTDDADGQAAVRRVVDDLVDTMRSHPGCVGIAAPQIGELVRIAVVDVTGHRRADSCAGLLVLVNPVVAARRGAVRMREGCLSIPDFTGDVTRAAAIDLTHLDRDGEARSVSCDAYEARVVLHELDHLDGLLFLDRVARASDVFPRRRYR